MLYAHHRPRGKVEESQQESRPGERNDSKNTDVMVLDLLY